eukprot:467847_1
MTPIFILLILLFAGLQLSSQGLEFKTTKDCDYYNENTYSTSSEQIISDSVIIKNNTLQIQFYLKLNEYCTGSCNILYLHNHNNVGDLSLCINGIENYLEISVVNDLKHQNIFRLYSANSLLKVDNQYHKIHLSYLYGSYSIYDKNLLQIDNIMHVYHSSFPSTISQNQSYELYVNPPWNAATSVNASISNMCIKSPQNLKVFDINCNDTVIGNLDAQHHDDFFFNLTNDSFVLFDSCASTFRAILYLIDVNSTVLFSANDGEDGEKCGQYTNDQDWSSRGKLLIQKLPAGQYSLEVAASDTGSGSYVVDVVCENNNIITNTIANNSYNLMQNCLSTGKYEDSETSCEKQLGTSLATIITVEDMENALSCINKEIVKFHLDNYTNVSLPIGMYNDIIGVDKNKWLWITPNNSVSVYKKNTNWYKNQSNWHQINDTLPYIATWLVGAAGTAFESFGVYPVPITIFADDDSFTYCMFLCNGADSKYNLPTCADRAKCWDHENQVDDKNVTDDIIKADESSANLEFQAPIAYWNKTLFIIGEQYIHYVDIDLFNHGSKWRQKLYNDKQLKSWNLAARYAQHKSSLYLHSFKILAKDPLLYNVYYLEVYLIEINLDNLEIQYHLVPYYIADYEELMHEAEKICVVANADFVFIILQELVITYDVGSSLWNVSFTTEMNIVPGYPISCTMSIDSQYIYILAESRPYYAKGFNPLIMIQYNISSGMFELPLEIPNPCVVNDRFVNSVLGANGKIYFHGCNISPWKTLIFNTETHRFENQTIDIVTPVKTDIPYYRSAQLASVDDNILLLFYQTNTVYPYDISSNKTHSYKLYFALTDIISINLMQTIRDNPIWPSDFMIEYQLNDFNNTNNTYNIVFRSMHPIITAYAILNTSNDNCICNESFYQCFNCSQHFDLKDYLLPKDNDIDVLQLISSTDDSETSVFPSYILIPLTRCNITFKTVDISSTSEEPSITFQFELSTNCYSRTGTTFSLNITSSQLHIAKQLMINIINNCTIKCNVCQIGSDSCIACDEYSFIIYHQTNRVNEGTYNIMIDSNRNDFRVISSNHSIKYFKLKPIVNDHYLYLLFLGIIPLCICSILMYFKHEYGKAFVVNRALVLIIGISEFDDDELQLPGVVQNIINLKELWQNKYNYDVFVCNQHTLYSTKINIMDFIDNHCKLIDSDTYQAVIVHVLSHGSGHSFTCSEGNQVEIEFIIHELTNAEEFNGSSSVVKLIFNHGCRGNVEYHHGADEFNPKTVVSRGYNMHASINKNNAVNVSSDANLMIISGTIAGRTLSDSGNFTECICESFGKNVDRIIKADFNSLYVEIGNNLEEQTKHAELCNINGTLRFNPLRFEKYKHKNLLAANGRLNAQYDYIELASQ